MPTTKAIGYCRISTEKQLDGVSLENQQDRIAAYCAYKGFELSKMITDEAISGAKNKDRTGLIASRAVKSMPWCFTA